MATSVSIEPFDASKVEWDSWSRRFDQWLKISPYAEGENAANKMRAAFCTFIGSDAFKLLCCLCAPNKPEDCGYEDLKAKLDAQYGVKRLVLVERYHFYNYKQSDGQSLTNYLAELRRLSATCDWTAQQLADNLRDRFVMGLKNERLLQQLLTKDHKKPLEILFQLALTFEAAERESLKRADSSSANSNSVAATTKHKHPKQRAGISASKKPPLPRQSSGTNVTVLCASCGGNHLRSTCKFRNAKCHSCGKHGHIQKVCRGTAGVVQPTIQSPDSAVVPLTNPKQENSIPPMFQILQLPEFERQLKLIVDSASPLTFVNSKTWLDLNKPRLQSTTKVLGAFEGQPIKPLGYFEARAVRLDDSTKSAVIKIYVSKNGINILGRDGLTKLNVSIDPSKFGAVSVVEFPSPRTLQDVLDVNAELFSPELGHCITLKANLVLSDDVTPKFCKPRKLPFAIKPVVGDELDRLENQGVIKKVPHSDWATPIVVVRKPGGKVRICGDFKITINPVLKTDVYPLPLPDELFQSLNGGSKFSKIDLADAYLQIELDEESKKLVVVNTHKGLYQYQRLPFGLSCAPALFQKIIDQTISDIPGVVCYLDDIIVTGKTDQEHIANLQKALERLRAEGFHLKREKCQFFQSQVQYLGHIIDKDGIRPVPEKIKAIVDMPKPNNPKELRSFLGMVNYYDRFTPGLASKCACLNDLLHKDAKWKWTNKHSQAMNSIKASLTSTDSLSHYDPQLPLSLACDASSVGVGAVIFHTLPNGTEKVVAYASRKLSPAEKKYAQIQREALSIVYGVQKFRQYLLGRKFCLLTDHKPLLTIFNPEKGIPEMISSRLQRWAIILSAYTYEVKYKPSDQHGNADGLSRLPLELGSEWIDESQDTVCLLEQLQLNQLPIKASDIRQETAQDSVLSKVYNFTMRGWPNSVNALPNDLKPFYKHRLNLSTFNGCLLLGLKVVIPKKYYSSVLNLLHEGHPGITRMKSLSRLHVWWPTINTDIEQTVRSCSNCQEAARDPVRVPLHQWDTPRNPWQRLHIDYAGPYRGTMWLLVIDAYSKWPEVHAMSATTAQATVQQLRKIFAIHGLPQMIVSDNGPQFVSEEFEQFCSSRGIRHNTIAPYHPRSNGEAERLVETFKKSIDKANPKTASQLQDAVIDFLAKYRSTPHTVTNSSPSELLNNRRLRTILDLLHPCQTDTAKRKEQQKLSYDSHTQPRQFGVGDAVWARNFRQGPRWSRATVTECLGNVMYKVQLEEQPRLIWRRHANQLRTRIVPVNIDNNSDHNLDTNDGPVLNNPLPLRRSSRARKPTRRWVPDP